MAVSLDDIKNFLVVSKTLNVTRASEILGLSQPTLSYSIKRIESEVGADLIIRLKTGVKITKFGEAFLVKARRLELEWESLVNSINSDGSEYKGRYTFAIHPSVALANMGVFLPELTKKFPYLNIEFVHGLSREMTEKVINWEADFGIVVNPISHPDLVIKKLKKDVITLFAKKNTKKKLIYNPKLSQSHALIKKLKDFKFNGEIHSNNMEVIAKLASLGEGYALLPTSIASTFRSLSAIEGSPCYNDEICFIYRPEKHKNKVSKSIIKIFSSLLVEK